MLEFLNGSPSLADLLEELEEEEEESLAQASIRDAHDERPNCDFGMPLVESLAGLIVTLRDKKAALRSFLAFLLSTFFFGAEALEAFVNSGVLLPHIRPARCWSHSATKLKRLDAMSRTVSF